ncbi:MAG: chemotaxis protein CheB [Planctomycetota bacterium]|jgi:two-component system chemotaxis response regulator CheB
MIRVLVVDDSLTVRKTITDRLRTAGIEVVGEAADGSEAAALTHRLRPDVVLMDVVMPRVDGLAATRRIMTEIPTPVVILTAFADQQEVFKTYDALAAGALDVCAKPEGDARDRETWEDIVRTVRAATQVAVRRHRRSTKSPEERPNFGAELPVTVVSERQRKIVVIGASTGGPAAVHEILQSLPPDFPLPILVALHCSTRLSASVASWFARRCAFNVYDARHEEPLPGLPGTVIVVPPGRNLTISRGQMLVHDPGNTSGCTPSVDELFASAADSHGDATIGVLLTGMGTDGARGLKRIRDCGGCAIAQDEASCVVFGMPAAAIKL